MSLVIRDIVLITDLARACDLDRSELPDGCLRIDMAQFDKQFTPGNELPGSLIAEENELIPWNAEEEVDVGRIRTWSRQFQ